MASEWGTYFLHELGKIVTGKTPSSKVGGAYASVGIPFITPRDMDGRKVITSTERYLSKYGVAAVKNSVVPANAVAVSCIGSDMGKAVILGNESVSNQQINTIVVNSREFNPEYIYYVLSTKQEALKSIASGSATPILNKTHFGQFQIKLPKKATQDYVVSTLKPLDDKIELNKKINQTLEQMAQALFKSWFVDFDPVFDNLLDKHHNNLEKAKAYLESKGAEDLCPKLTKRFEKRQQLKDQKPLPQDIRNLFPSDFHHNQDLGWIPEGWEASSLGEHFNIVMGQSPKGDTYNEVGDGMVFFQGRRDFGFRYPTPRVYTTDPKRIANKGDTLISVRAPVGDRNLAATECCLGRGVASLKHKSGSTSFTYYLVGIIESKLADRGADGTVFSSINKKELAGFPFIAPNEEAISSFDSLVRSFDKNVEVNSTQVNELEEIRNTLLPRLINGTLKLGE